MLSGAVIEKSALSKIRIEVYHDTQKFTEGSLLSVGLGGHQVLYQIINAVTDSKFLVESNKHGYMTIEARKLGRWNNDEHRFEAVQWTPNIYAPVFLAPESEAVGFQREFIGFVPRTRYGIKVDTQKLVTHNTAILGVLGSGKTGLALELIQRMVQDGIKVCVIDITGQYEPALQHLIDKKKQSAADEAIRKEISPSANCVNQNKESGGNHREFAASLNLHIKQFMEEDWGLRVFNPGAYAVTEQTSGLFNKAAGIGDLTNVQKSRIVAEQFLKCVQDQMSEKARLCLVLEEAHSLVTEWNSVSSDGDKNATNGTAKAIMQGRKYGFGCLLITQRTANVTKSNLNQCNTVFGLRVFDDTGKDFLSNYFGRDYAAMLPELQPRHCIAYGSALNTQTPLIVELNDKDECAKHFHALSKSQNESDETDDREPETKGST